jgi:hypothetical protein
MTFTKADQGNLYWDFQTGVGDIYSLALRYSNRSAGNLKVKLELFSSDGTLMRTEFADLSASFEGKWSYFTTTTGSMINAGTYTLKISAVNAATLSISQLQVQ